MNLIVALYAGVLFFLLTPNVLLRIPKKGSVRMVAFVHAIVFALVLFLTSKLLIHLVNNITGVSSKKEGLDTASRDEEPDVPPKKQGFDSMSEKEKQGFDLMGRKQGFDLMSRNQVEGLGQKCTSSNDCNGGEICGQEGTCTAAVNH